MEWNDVIKIATAVIVSLGGGGIIVLNLSKFLGDLFAKKYEEKVKATFQNDINQFQSHLDILKQTTIRYSDKQFELYHFLWSSLNDLKILADDLWSEANSSRMEKFIKQLKKTTIDVEKAALFIEDDHYMELSKLLNQFSNYQMGKVSLIKYRSQYGYDDSFEIRAMVSHNGELKKQYDRIIIEIKDDLRQQLRGTNTRNKLPFIPNPMLKNPISDKIDQF